MATEAELQHLYQLLHGALDHEGATTMIDLLGPYARHEPATKADLELIRHELRSEIAQMGQRLTNVLVVSQGVTVAVIGVLIALS